MRQAEVRSGQADPLGNIDDWMAGRWADLERRGSGAESTEGAEVVELGAGPDTGAPQPMDLGLRFQAARAGDSISRLVGSSDPRAIGKFLALNGMDGASSSLRSGRSYIVPTHWDDATGSEAEVGQALLGADNARLRTLADQQAEQARQAERFGEGRNIWTGEPVDVGPRPNIQPSQRPSRQRSRLDDNPAAKAMAGTLGWGLGLAPGVVRGGVNTIKGAGGTAYFLARLNDPYDSLRSLPGQSASEQLLDAGRGFAGYVDRAVDDPSVVRADIDSALNDFRLRQNPFATPAADTLGGEFRRTFDIGMNNGELVTDVGSMAVGGGFLGGAARLGKAAKAADAVELAFLAKHPGLAARWEQPYSGMSHHIHGRKKPLPAWLGGGPAPQWFIESEFNKIRHEGITWRDLLRNHAGVDGSYRGGKVGVEYGGTRWNAKDLGWTKYGPLDRLNYGTSPYTKAAVGPVLFGGPIADMADFEARQ